MDMAAESEKVLNVPSILHIPVIMFLNVDHLGGDIFSVISGKSVGFKQNSRIKSGNGLYPPL